MVGIGGSNDFVLQLGNLTFQADERDESKSIVPSCDELRSLAVELLGVTEEELLAALTIQTNSTE